MSGEISPRPSRRCWVELAQSPGIGVDCAANAWARLGRIPRRGLTARSLSIAVLEAERDALANGSQRDRLQLLRGSGLGSGLNTASVLAAFDQQVRRWPEAAPGDTVEHADHVIRHVSRTDGWSGVVWSDLDAGNADAVIAAQIAHFSALAQDWEWKHYSYDQPRDLPERLRAAGFDTEPTETLLVAEVSELGPSAHAPGGVEIRSVRTAEEVDALLTVHAAAFGQDDAGLRELMLASLSSDDPHVEAVVAWADGAPIAAGRVEFYGGTEFAGLWGGGTLPGWRHRGVFRALVSHRAGLAARRGYRYLQVDAEDTSRPIFERLGFAELAKTTPFTYRSPRAGARSGEKPEAYGRSA